MNPVNKLKDSFEKIALILSQLKKDPDVPLMETLDSCHDRLTYLIENLDDTSVQLDATQNYIYQILHDLSPIMETLSHYKEKCGEDTKQPGNRYQALQSYKRYKM